MATTQQSGFAPADASRSTIVQTPDDAIVANFTSILQGINACHARPKQSDGPASGH